MDEPGLVALILVLGFFIYITVLSPFIDDMSKKRNRQRNKRLMDSCQHNGKFRVVNIVRRNEENLLFGEKRIKIVETQSIFCKKCGKKIAQTTLNTKEP